MTNIYTLILVVILTMSQVLVKSQDFKSEYTKAEDFVEDENYYKAMESYQMLLNENPNNANLNFKMGYCYLNTATQKVKAISFLEFATDHISEDYNSRNYAEISAPLESLFYLGKAYHVNYRFDDAERTFFNLKKMVSASEADFIAKIDHELTACQVARVLIKSPIEMSVSNLGREINSTYSEHSPVISGDESVLVYTSKRKGNTGGRQTDDGQYFEDIYISSFDGKKYTQAKKISTAINTAGHDASIGLSFDGTKLLIYRDDEGDGNIYMSTRNGSQWENPELLPEVINSKSRETHASLSFDQNDIYFTSDRKGGYGGLDIYRVRKLPNGNWSKAKNMGPNINTAYDEEGPYLHPDGTSLYFSSQGHNTMGGFDIFVSFVDENDNWGTAENVGYPINTPDDDVYYVPSVDGRRAYYASYANNSIGNYDIFRIDLSETHRRNQTVIAGLARKEDNTPLENPMITISDMDDELVGVYAPDLNSGKFLIILPRGRTFHALFEASNTPDREFDIRVPEYSYDQTGKLVIFDDIIIGGTVRKIYANQNEKVVDEMLAAEALAIDELEKNEGVILAANVSNKTKSEKAVADALLLTSAELLDANELNSGAASNTQEFDDEATANSNLVLDNSDDGDGANASDAVSADSKRVLKTSKESGNSQMKKNVSGSSSWWFIVIACGFLITLFAVLRRKRR